MEISQKKLINYSKNVIKSFLEIKMETRNIVATVILSIYCILLILSIWIDFLFYVAILLLIFFAFIMNEIESIRKDKLLYELELKIIMMENKK